MADIHQKLEDVRKEIQEAKIEKSAALAKGDTSYAAALVAQLTSLQNEKLFLMKQQQKQGEKKLSMTDLLTKLQLSSSPTIGRLSASCTTSIHALPPMGVKEWAKFQSEAKKWCKTAASTSTHELIVPPKVLKVRVDGIKIRQESSVYAYFDEEITPAFEVIFGPDGLGPRLKIGMGNLGNGQADRSVQEVASDRVLVPIEMKHSGVLNSSTMSTPLHEYVAPEDNKNKTGHQKAVEQIFGYLARNDLWFGLLCSNNEYWFCRRTKGAFYISLPLQHNQFDPTVIGALCYISHLAAEDAARRASAIQTSPPGSVPRNAKKGPKAPLIPGLPFSAPLILSHLAIWLQKLIMDVRRDSPASKTYSAASLNLDLDELLGSGGTGSVFAGSTSLGLPLAIKVPSKHGRQHYGPKECERSLEEEADNYQALKELQGKVIPRLIARGTVLNEAHDKIPFIAVERIMDSIPLKEAAGILAPAMLERVAEQASASVRSLHQLGVAHGDVDNGGNNILVTPAGKVWLIDLGSAVMNASEESLEREERELRGLLQQHLQVDPLGRHNHQGPASSSPLFQQHNINQNNMKRQALPHSVQQRKALHPIRRKIIAPTPVIRSGIPMARAFV